VTLPVPASRIPIFWVPHRSGAWRSLPPSRQSIIRKPNSVSKSDSYSFNERIYESVVLSDINSSCTILTHSNSGAGPCKALLDVRLPLYLARQSTVYQAELEIFPLPPQPRHRRRQRPQDSSRFSSPQVVTSYYRSSSAQRNSPFLANGRTRTSRRTWNKSRLS
jgi:hypothetical protein